MELEQSLWTPDRGWQPSIPGSLSETANLVLVFGSTATLKSRGVADIALAYPHAQFLGCSTAGNIRDTEVSDDSLALTAVRFESTRVASARVRMDEVSDSYAAGKELAHAFDPHDLVHVFVLSDGLCVNGSELVRGLTHSLPPGVTVTGGLSGDGDRFQETLVLYGHDLVTGVVAAIGLYGSRLRVGYGSLGGWDPFGPERCITRSRGNVLYELDGQSALALYKEYLGEHAAGLPATGLLYPLSLRTKDGSGLVRTILAIDEAEQSLTFAGDVPEGTYARLMKANFDRLIDGAAGAARTSSSGLGSVEAELAILISCVGRKLILKQRVEEEVESVRDVLGDRAAMLGFYSYGEISPLTPQATCELHNQTMTVTTFSEA